MKRILGWTLGFAALAGGSELTVASGAQMPMNLDGTSWDGTLQAKTVIKVWRGSRRLRQDGGFNSYQGTAVEDNTSISVGAASDSFNLVSDDDGAVVTSRSLTGVLARRVGNGSNRFFDGALPDDAALQAYAEAALESHLAGQIDAGTAVVDSATGKISLRGMYDGTSVQVRQHVRFHADLEIGGNSVGITGRLTLFGNPTPFVP
jgi:hypothetical protein